MTCYSDLPVDTIIWWYNYNDTNFCKFDDSCTIDSPFANSTSNTSDNGTVHQLMLPVGGALQGAYSCGIYPVPGNTAVQRQNITFYGKP